MLPWLFPLCAWLWGVSGLACEAVSSPSFPGSPRMLLSSTERTQAVRTSRRPVVQYFIQEEIYTHLSLAGGAASPGHGCYNTATAVFVQRKEPRFPWERCRARRSPRLSPAQVLSSSPSAPRSAADIFQEQQKEEAAYCA